MTTPMITSISFQSIRSVTLFPFHVNHLKGEAKCTGCHLTTNNTTQIQMANLQMHKKEHSYVCAQFYPLIKGLYKQDTQPLVFTVVLMAIHASSENNTHTICSTSLWMLCQMVTQEQGHHGPRKVHQMGTQQGVGALICHSDQCPIIHLCTCVVVDSDRTCCILWLPKSIFIALSYRIV